MKHFFSIIGAIILSALWSLEADASLKLLSVDPTDGSEITRLNKITLYFETSGGEYDGCVRFVESKIGECYAENLGDNSKTALEFDWNWGGSATVTFADDLSKGDYKIMIVAGTIYDYDNEDDENEDIVLNYTVLGQGEDDPSDNIRSFPHTISPLEGNISSLEEIRISFEEKDIFQNWEYDGDGCVLTDANGNIIYTLSGNYFNWNINYDAEGSEFYVKFLGNYYNETYEEDDCTEDAEGRITYPIKEAGTYTLTFPEAFFRHDSYDSSWNLTSEFNDEMQFTWTVTDSPYNDGITEISSYEQLLPYTDSRNEDLKLKVVADFTVEDFIRIPGEVTLDLNGHTITLDGKLAITGQDILIVEDSSDSKAGEIVTNVKGAILVQGEASLYVRGGNFSAQGDLAGMYPLIEIGKYSNTTIEGGYFSRPSNYYAVKNEGNLLIKGGTFVSKQGVWELILTTSEGVTTVEDGAFYAGNMTHGVCFETTYWTDGQGDSETATLILPEGTIDGGAVVLSEKWAIPETCYINYALPAKAVMQPGMHYYSKGQAFPLPECDRMEGVPFAGWSKIAGVSNYLLTEVTADMFENLQLYPIWKYTQIADGVSIDISPKSYNPAQGAELTELSSVIITFDVEEGEDLFLNSKILEAARVQKMNWGIAEDFCGVTVLSLHDGSIQATFEKNVDMRGEYCLYIPAGAVGDEEYQNSGYEKGHCNPDIFYTFNIISDTPGSNGYNTDPSDGAHVDALEVIRFIFEDETVMYSYDKVECVLTDQSGNYVTAMTYMNCSYEGDDIVMELPFKIDEPGTYYLTVPVGFFGYEYGEVPIAERILSWTVDDKNGIDKVSEDTRADVFDMNGRIVRFKATSADLKDLPAGIYIWNNHKIMVK